MMYVVGNLQEIVRKAGVSLFVCFFDLQILTVLLTAPLPGRFYSHRSTTVYHSSNHKLVCHLIMASDRIGSRWSKDYGKDAAIAAVVLTYSSQPC